MPSWEGKMAVLMGEDDLHSSRKPRKLLHQEWKRDWSLMPVGTYESHRRKETPSCEWDTSPCPPHAKVGFISLLMTKATERMMDLLLPLILLTVKDRAGPLGTLILAFFLVCIDLHPLPPLSCCAGFSLLAFSSSHTNPPFPRCVSPSDPVPISHKKGCPRMTWQRASLATGQKRAEGPPSRQPWLSQTLLRSPTLLSAIPS